MSDKQISLSDNAISFLRDNNTYSLIGGGAVPSGEVHGSWQFKAQASSKNRTTGRSRSCLMNRRIGGDDEKYTFTDRCCSTDRINRIL